MKLRQITLALAIGAMGASAQAALWTGNFQTSNGASFHDGVLLNIDGLDIYSQGSAAFFCATTGGCAGGAVPQGTQINPGTVGNIDIGDKVTTVYQGVVNAFNTGVSSPNLRYPGQAGSYQLTVAAIFNEVVVGGGTFLGGAFALMQPLTPGSRVSIFFDDATLSGTFIDGTADILAGKGYTDGMLIYDAYVNGPASLPTNYTVVVPNATGNANIVGKTLFAQSGVDDPLNVADVVGFMPDTPDGFTSTTTIQFGNGIAEDYETNKFFDNANGWTSIAVNKDLTVRADANLDFLRVPEPATLALLGLGLAGLGLSLRRRAA